MKNYYIIVFDMDETLGSFSQLYNFWSLTKKYLNNQDLDKKYLFDIIDLFPNFLRTNLIKILNNIKDKKKRGICHYVMIYTNNNGPNEWCNNIRDYLHYKINYKLFDKTIRAFKINGKQIEICRTSNGKSYKDLINCSKLPNNTKVCFLDDVYHYEMVDNNVTYLHLKPYNNNEDYYIMCDKFYKKNPHLFNTNLREYINFINSNVKDGIIYNNLKSNNEKKADIIVSKSILKNINNFFNSKKDNILKKRTNKKRKKNYKKSIKKV